MTERSTRPDSGLSSSDITPAVRAGRHSRRRFLAALAAAGAGVAAWTTVPRVAMAQAALPGILALPRAREVALVQPDGQGDRAILSLQTGEFVADVALSPDGSRVAFGLFTARTGDGPGGSDIIVTASEPGAEHLMVAPRDRPGMLLAAPYWSPDSRGLIFEAVGLGANNQPTISAEWINLDGTGRRTVAMNARYPSISPDGQKVVYTLARQTGDALVEQPLGGGETREIIPEGQFLVIAYPRYSPDGSQIAFAGVGDSIMTGPPGLPLRPEPATSPSIPKRLTGTGLDSWRGVAAHGFPADPWIVAVAGGEPRQLAALPVDDAAIAWSPDGSMIASSGAPGIFLISPTDGSSRQVSEMGSFGAIDWR
jgi:Tol biopolymer transport system component